MAAGKGQMQNVQMKKNKNLLTAKTAMQCRKLKARKGNLNG